MLVEDAVPDLCVRCTDVKPWYKPPRGTQSQLCVDCYDISQQEWETPPDLMQAIGARFGRISLDPCCSSDNRKGENWYSLEDEHDGLVLPWITEAVKTAYCNPGFGELEKWAPKAYAEAQREDDATVLLLGTGGFSSEWWRWCAERAWETLLLSPRPQFIAAKGIKESSNAGENTLFVFKSEVRIVLAVERPRIQSWRWKS